MGGGIGIGKTCKSMADSFQWMTKPTTIKKKKKKKNRIESRSTPTQIWSMDCQQSYKSNSIRKDGILKGNGIIRPPYIPPPLKSGSIFHTLLKELTQNGPCLSKIYPWFHLNSDCPGRGEPLTRKKSGLCLKFLEA